MDRDKLLNDICSGGFRLRKTVTVDKSKPIITAEGEAPLKVQKFSGTESPEISSSKSPTFLEDKSSHSLSSPGPTGVLLAHTTNMNPPPPPPMPGNFVGNILSAPPPPPPIQNLAKMSQNIPKPKGGSTKTLPKSFSTKMAAPPDRDAMLEEIRMGARLRPTKTVDKSKPILGISSESAGGAKISSRRSSTNQDQDSDSEQPGSNLAARKPSLLMDELSRKLAGRPSTRSNDRSEIDHPAPNSSAITTASSTLKRMESVPSPVIVNSSIPPPPPAPMPSVLLPSLNSSPPDRYSGQTFSETSKISPRSAEPRDRPIFADSTLPLNSAVQIQTSNIGHDNMENFYDNREDSHHRESSTKMIPHLSPNKIGNASPEDKEKKQLFTNNTSPTIMSDIDTEFTGSDETESGVGTADWGSSVSPTRESSSPEVYEPLNLGGLGRITPSRIIYQRGDSCWPPATAPAHRNSTESSSGNSGGFPEVRGHQTDLRDHQDLEEPYRPRKIDDRIRQFQEVAESKTGESADNFRTYRRNPVKTATTAASLYKEASPSPNLTGGSNSSSNTTSRSTFFGASPRRSGSVSDIAHSLTTESQSQSSSRSQFSPLPTENRPPRRQGSIHDLVQQIEKIGTDPGGRNSPAASSESGGKFAARYIHTGDVRRSIETFQAGGSAQSSRAESVCSNSPGRVLPSSRSSRESFDAISKGFSSPNGLVGSKGGRNGDGEYGAKKPPPASIHWMGTGRVEDRSKKFESFAGNGNSYHGSDSLPPTPTQTPKRPKELQTAANYIIEKISSPSLARRTATVNSPTSSVVSNSSSTSFYTATTETSSIFPSARPPLQRNYSKPLGSSDYNNSELSLPGASHSMTDNHLSPRSLGVGIELESQMQSSGTLKSPNLVRAVNAANATANANANARERLGSVLRQKPVDSASMTQTWRHVSTTRDVLSRPGVAAVEQIIKNKQAAAASSMPGGSSATIVESTDGRHMYNAEFLENQNPADLPLFLKMVISDDLQSPTVACRRRSSENGF